MAGYNKPDFVNVNYYNDVSVCRYALEQIEKLIKESFIKAEIMEKISNARSSKKAKKNSK
jgi:ribosomal protein L19E